jgi:hypothetical protein
MIGGGGWLTSSYERWVGWLAVEDETTLLPMKTNENHPLT